MIRRPPRSTLDRSSAASDVYKRQESHKDTIHVAVISGLGLDVADREFTTTQAGYRQAIDWLRAVSYTHLRAHETVLDLVCRLLLEKKK